VRGEQLPAATHTSLYELSTADGATVTGTLRSVPGASTVVSIMHPRQDLTHHPLVPHLLAAGAAVWTQGSRSVNNDLNLVHEQALLDAAAGLGHVRDLGFDRWSRWGTPVAARCTPTTTSSPGRPRSSGSRPLRPGARPGCRRRSCPGRTARCSWPRTPGRGS
jgi:hypothetical protein